MTDASRRLSAALSDRYRIERAATPVAARHNIAPRFMTDASDRLATALSDRYRIERELGQGGMATPRI